MSDTENKQITAVCRDCGHTWKPRNTTTNDPRRKCSKCGSENIDIKTEDSPAVKSDTPPTPENILKLINTPPAENPPEAKQNTVQPQTDAAGAAENDISKIYPFPNIHPAAWFLILAGLISAGAIIYFRTKRQRQRKAAPPKTQRSNPEKTEQKPAAVTPRIVGL
jgi:DNA-directed RNA polymerase subunit M/transcription elongation factor TFIIS